MYENPIEKVFEEIQSQIIEQDDENVMCAVKQAVGYLVDKNELIKALKYDREQYEKGYHDGLNADKWIPVSERLPDKDKYIDFYKCLVAVNCTSRNDICDSFTAYFDGKHFYMHLYDRAIISGVKAWMPLPESYKVESEDKE